MIALLRPLLYSFHWSHLSPLSEPQESTQVQAANSKFSPHSCTTLNQPTKPPPTQPTPLPPQPNPTQPKHSFSPPNAPPPPHPGPHPLDCSFAPGSAPQPERRQAPRGVSGWTQPSGASRLLSCFFLGKGSPLNSTNKKGNQLVSCFSLGKGSPFNSTKKVPFFFPMEIHWASEKPSAAEVWSCQNLSGASAQKDCWE